MKNKAYRNLNGNWYKTNRRKERDRNIRQSTDGFMCKDHIYESQENNINTRNIIVHPSYFSLATKMTWTYYNMGCGGVAA